MNKSQFKLVFVLHNLCKQANYLKYWPNSIFYIFAFGIIRFIFGPKTCGHNFPMYIHLGCAWMEVEASIPQHTSETFGSLQALWQSCISRQVHSLCVWDGRVLWCGGDRSTLESVVCACAWHKEQKQRGRPARDRCVHLRPLCTSRVSGFTRIHTNTHGHMQNTIHVKLNV